MKNAAGCMALREAATVLCRRYYTREVKNCQETGLIFFRGLKLDVKIWPSRCAKDVQNWDSRLPQECLTHLRRTP